MAALPDTWPELHYEEYKDTRDTLHMYTQIAGKLRLALTPPLSQWAHSPLRLSADGLATGPLWVGDGVMNVDLDLIRHEARFERSDGRRATVKLGQGAVADVYGRVLTVLDELDVAVKLNPMPQEIPAPIPLDTDTTHVTYDPRQANLLWQALIRVGSVYEQAQSGFWGKQSPVSYYWGGFDLAVTRYSGRPLQPPEGLPQIMTGSLDAELANISFYLGNEQMPQAFFMAAAFPPPQGMESARVRPAQARFVEMPGMGGTFVLTYDDVRAAGDPRAALLEFCRSGFETLAELGGWDRALLERKPPEVRKTV
jgi:hypothetical protein